MLLVLLVESIATVAAAGWWHYQKVYLVPDYVAGYDMGSQWRSERVEDDCAKEASARYLHANTPHWHAFLDGCEDGLQGTPAAGWNLRSRLLGD
jgi:hypothetical protein